MEAPAIFGAEAGERWLMLAARILFAVLLAFFTFLLFSFMRRDNSR
ncbi:MAG: hypothetical protein OHK0029_09660 [Armatimonadaceae bacterium]